MTGVVSLSFGMNVQSCDMIMKRGGDLSIAVGSLALSGKCAGVERPAEYDCDPAPARPPCAGRKRFKTPLDQDGNDRYRMSRQNQPDSRLKRPERSILRSTSFGKPH